MSRHEGAIRDIVRRELEPCVDELQIDQMGNVVGTLFAETDFETVVGAHMDEIGFMVRHVDERGFLKLTPLGECDDRVLRSQQVTIHTDGGDVPGIIGSPPPHTQDNTNEESLTVNDIQVDLGLESDEANEAVSMGDLVTMKQRTEIVGNHVTGKALDDRVSLLVLIETAQRIDDPNVTIHFTATVQEEVGIRGALALGFDLDADLAIGLDVTVANDVPGFSADESVTRLGEGAAIKLQDNSVIPNPKVHRRIRRVAERNGIPYQMEVFPSGGTDTAGFQRGGGPTVVGGISVPTRYMHTVTESVDPEDVQAVIELLISFLESETSDFDYSL